MPPLGGRAWIQKANEARRPVSKLLKHEFKIQKVLITKIVDSHRLPRSLKKSIFKTPVSAARKKELAPSSCAAPRLVAVCR